MSTCQMPWNFFNSWFNGPRLDREATLEQQLLLQTEEVANLRKANRLLKEVFLAAIEVDGWWLEPDQYWDDEDKAEIRKNLVDLRAAINKYREYYVE